MNIFTEISIILIITTGIATIMRIFRQPLIIGYLVSGIIIGPYGLGILHSTHEVELFSKVGIALLLFIVGLSLNPDTVKETGKSSVIIGLGQIIFTSGIGFIILKLLGYATVPALYGAVALTFSSTIIVMKLLSDRGELKSLHGKIAIGMLLVQDIVATLLLIILPLIGAQQALQTNVGWEFARLAGSGIGMSIGLYIIAKYILPKFSDYLAKSGELLFIFSVSWGLVLATIFYLIGFSIEIGALIAGVTLSASKYAFEISSRMRPLRDFFIVMFFVLLGSQLILTNIGILIIPALILGVFVLIGNPLIVFIMMHRLGYAKKSAFITGLTVAQISEFSLILMALGLSLGHVDQSMVTLITLVGITTIIGSTYFMMYADQCFNFFHKLFQRITRHRLAQEKNLSNTEDHYDMMIFGFGRVGLEFVEKAQEKQMKYLVVDYDPEVFKRFGTDTLSYRFGDVEDVEFLEEIRVENAAMILSTIPDIHTNLLLLRYYRKQNTTGIALVTCHSVHDADRLYEAGATYVILPHYLGARHATEMIHVYEENPDIFFQERQAQAEQMKKHLTL